jgi:hypothetical protein
LSSQTRVSEHVILKFWRDKMTGENKDIVQKPFWKIMCSSDDKIRAMSKRHDNPDEALNRCVELARKNPGAEFYVMKAEYRVKCNDVTVEKLGVNK